MHHHSLEFAKSNISDENSFDPLLWTAIEVGQGKLFDEAYDNNCKNDKSASIIDDNRSRIDKLPLIIFDDVSFRIK